MDHFIRTLFVFGIAIATAALSGACSSAPLQRQPAAVVAPVGHVTLSSSEVANGSVVRITATLASLPRFGRPRITGTFEGQTVPLYQNEDDPQVYEGWIGIPVQHPPGDSEIRVVNGEGPGAEVENLPIQIVPGRYKTQKLKVDRAKAHPSPKDQARIEREDAELKSLYANPRAERFWTHGFERPLNTPVTAEFGSERIFNGQPQGWHFGIDLRAAVGTPVRAAASGIVVLAKDLFISGRTLVIDHGQGFFTLYGHLSDIRYPVGTRVNEGEIIGFSGSSGRATGPHLHWATILNGVAVNPLDVIELTR